MSKLHGVQNRSLFKAFASPVKVRTDILMSIKPEHMSNIASGKKNHEYRRYLLPSSIKRIWFYSSAPVSSVQYIARVGPGRKPGEVPEDGGIGNQDFNAGRKVSKYGYEIQKLWRLRNPITLPVARSKGYLKGPPQKYNWVQSRLIEEYPLERQERVITKSTAEALGPERKFRPREEVAEEGQDCA